MKPRIYKIVYREDKSIYIFRTPRTEKEFQTYKEARAAFFYPALVAYNCNYFPSLYKTCKKPINRKWSSLQQSCESSPNFAIAYTNRKSLLTNRATSQRRLKTEQRHGTDAKISICAFL